MSVCFVPIISDATQDFRNYSSIIATTRKPSRRENFAMAHNAVDNQSEIAELSGLQIMLLICLFSEKIRSPAFERVKTDKVVD